MSPQPSLQNQNGVYCQHFQEYDQEKLRELFSKVAAVRAENKEFFDFTHHPIDVYPAHGGTINEDRTVSEQDVLDDLLIGRPTNYAVVIQGVVGTGKSELCAYLEHELEDRDRPICRVQKDDDLMTILSQRIPEFYASEFGESIPDADNLDQLRKDLEKHPSTIANSATSSGLLRLSRTYELEYTDAEESQIQEHVKEKLKRLIDKENPGEKADIVKEEQYRDNAFLQVFAETIQPAEAAAELSEAILSEVFEFYDTPPLKELLKTVGEQFDDERPVMVFEDFSLPTKEAEKFRDYIERDNINDNWDFVIAGIADATRPLRRRTSEDRWAFYWTSKTDSNKVPYLDAQTAVDFIRPYLGYLKRHDGSVTYTETDSSRQFDRELEPPASNSICDQCGLCSDEFRDLFPFNDVFLKRVFEGLEESQQSPREYIDRIYEILREYACGEERVLPASADALYGISPESNVIIDDDVVTNAKPYSDLAKWYGEIADTTVTVDARLARGFYLLSEDNEPSDAAQAAGVMYDPAEDVICIPLAEDVHPSTTSTIETSTTTETTTTEPEETIQQTQSAEAKASDIIGDHLGKVENWQQDPNSDRYSDVRYYVSVALEDLLKYVTDDYTLIPDSRLRFNISSEQRPFIYQGSETTPEVYQIQIDPRQFELSQLRELFRYGVHLDEGSPQAQQEDTLQDFAVPLTYLGNQWRQKVCGEYLYGDDILYNYDPHYDFDDFLLASYAWLVLFDDPWTELTADTINDRFVSSDSLSLDAELQSVLEDEFSSLEDLETAFSFADDIEKLLQNRMGVTSNALNVPEVRRRLGYWQPYEVLDSLGRQKCRNIHSRVRMSPSLKLADYAEAFFDVHTEVEQLLSGGHDWEAASSLSAKLTGLSMGDFNDVVDGISSYDNVDPEFTESLRQFARLDQSEIEAVRTAAERCLDLDKTANQSLLEAKLIESKLERHKVMTRLTALNTEQRGGTTDFAERFKEVSSVYVE